MHISFRQSYANHLPIEEDFSPVNLRESIEKTRLALEIAYAGFDNAIEANLIDSYIYEINSLQKRYEHLTELASTEDLSDTGPLHQHSPIRTLVSHVFS